MVNTFFKERISRSGCSIFFSASKYRLQQIIYWHWVIVLIKCNVEFKYWIEICWNQIYNMDWRKIFSKKNLLEKYLPSGSWWRKASLAMETNLVRKHSLDVQTTENDRSYTAKQKIFELNRFSITLQQQHQKIQWLWNLCLITKASVLPKTVSGICFKFKIVIWSHEICVSIALNSMMR